MAQKGSNKWVKAAHIKKGTQGSFNQMSFSVLDAASQAVENEQGAAPRKLLGVIPLFTLNRKGETSSTSVPSKTLVKGDSSNETVDAGQKHSPAHQRPKEQSLSALAKDNAAALEPFEVRAVEKRSARVRRRVLVGAAVSLLVLLFVGYGGVTLYNDMQYQQTQFSTVNQALSLIAEADQTLTALNDAFANPTEDGAKQTLEDLSKKLPQAKLQLQRAKSMVEHGSDGVTDSRSKEIAARSLKAIAARIEMIEAGEALATQISNTLNAADSLEEAWSLMLQADAQARVASSQLLNPTEENLSKATSDTQEAIWQLDRARSELDRVADCMDVDISLYYEYVDKRKQALEAAQTAITYLADQDTEAARAAQDSYAKADNASAAVAAKLPQQPASYVFQAYQTSSQELVEKYSTARSSAGTADSMLREYYSSQRK